MAPPKTARLIAAKSLGSHARWLEFECVEPAALGFVGGQYVIVDTGLPLPSGKVAKRAYSILSPDVHQGRFEIVARRLGEGPGSNYLHHLELGSTLTFSGPWGKFVPDPGAAPNEKTLVVATDTGVTAALGLFGASSFAPSRARATLLWLSPSPDDFVDESFVRSRAAADGAEVRIATVPRVGHPERIGAGLEQFEAAFGQTGPERVYLAGDGALLYPFADVLAKNAVSPSQVFLECFFNNPAKKIGVSSVGGAT